MNFDYRQQRYVWRQLRDWDVISQPQFFFKVVEKKKSIEVTLFFVLDGREWKLDSEVSLDCFSTPYIYNWNEKDLERLITHLKGLIEHDVENLQL